MREPVRYSLIPNLYVGRKAMAIIMNIEVSFICDGIKFSTEKGSYTCALGGVTFMLSEGNFKSVDYFLEIENKAEIAAYALSMLERCFSTKDGEHKIQSFLLCEEELKTGKYRYFVCETKPIVHPDGTIGFVDTYYIDSVQALILLECMFSIRYNIPIIKCPNCGQFFMAPNNGMQYCDRVLENGKTCREVGAKKYFNDKLKADPLLSAYEKAYQATYHKHRKAADESEKEKLQNRLSLLKHSRMQYKKGALSADDFREIIGG